jgi:hypothetical protein
LALPIAVGISIMFIMVYNPTVRGSFREQSAKTMIIMTVAIHPSADHLDSTPGTRLVVGEEGSFNGIAKNGKVPLRLNVNLATVLF